MSAYFSPFLGKIIDADKHKADLVNGKIPSGQIPNIAISENLGTVANEAAMILIPAQVGDFVTRLDEGRIYELVNTDYTQASNWLGFEQPANVVLKSGSTMSGPLILSGNASVSLNPVPLQQLNSSLALKTDINTPITQVNATTVNITNTSHNTIIELTGACTVAIGSLTSAFQYCTLIQVTAAASTITGTFIGEYGQTATSAVARSRYLITRDSDGTVNFYIGA